MEVRGHLVDDMRTRAQNGPQSSQGSSKPVSQARASFSLSNLKFSVSHSTFTAPNREERATYGTKRERMSFVVGWVCRGTLKLPFWALRTAQATARGLVLAQGLIDAGGVEG